MANASRRLRFAYVNGYEIMTTDGDHVVIYEPRSPQDKAPWRRVTPVEGVHFRHNSSELKAIKPAGWRHQVTPEAAKSTEEADKRRKAYMSNEDVDRHLASARATGHLDPYWWRMS